MKARRKSDGEIIEVREWRSASDVIYSSPDMNHFYRASDLDFNVDAGGEEMLTVNRKRVQEFYAKCKEVTMNPKSCPDYAHESALSRMALLDILFGSKCLPDDANDGAKDSAKEPKPAEPKFKLGDIVRLKYSCTPYRIDGFKMLNGAMLYQVGEVWAEESDLEPYTEPKESPIPSIRRN